jgi:hypothetical protein
MALNNNHSSNNGRHSHLAAQELLDQLYVNLETLSSDLLATINAGNIPSAEQLAERDRMIGILESLLEKNLATISHEKIQSLIKTNEEIMNALNGSKESTKEEISSTFKQKEKIKKYNLKEVR